MKKVVSLFILSIIVIFMSVCVSARDLPKNMLFNEALGIQSIDDVKYGTIVFFDGLNYISADIDIEDLKNFLEIHWNFPMDRVTSGYNDETPRQGYINIWTDEKWTDNSHNKTRYTIYNRGDLIYCGYGAFPPDEITGISYSVNYVWYKPCINDGKEELDAIWAFLEEKYRDKARWGNEYTGNFYPNKGKNYLRLPTDEWAIPEVQQAATYNILPYELTENYDKPISRQDFCKLITQMLAQNYSEKTVSYSTVYADSRETLTYIDMLIKEVNPDFNYEDVVFLDEVTDEVKMLTTLGILSGRDNGMFDPEGKITREEATKALYETAKFFHNSEKLFTDVDINNVAFEDTNLISKWALECVAWATQNEIIYGVGENKFDPQGTYTVQQAIATAKRLYYKSRLIYYLQ